MCEFVCLDLCYLETKTVRHLARFGTLRHCKKKLTELTRFSSVWQTGSKLQTPSWEGSSSSRSHEIPRILWTWNIIQHYVYSSGPGSSVSVATDCGLDSPGSNPGGDEIFRPSRPALGPTQPPVKWVPGVSRRYSAAGACCWPLTPF